MSDQPADSPVLPPQPHGVGWSRNRFFFFIAFALAFHVALIVIFGAKEKIVPRERTPSAATHIPHLHLAETVNEFIALSDPTLFARPNRHDLVSAFWRRTPTVQLPDFNWTEEPRFLLPANENFGVAFHEWLRASEPAELPLDLKPDPKLMPIFIASEQTPPPNSTWQIVGDLATRPLVTPVELPEIKLNDVIAPSRVQLIVDTAGNVASAVSLPLVSAVEDAGRSDKADSNALVLARSLRFAPGSRLTRGEMIFRWHTLPLPATNAPSTGAIYER